MDGHRDRGPVVVFAGARDVMSVRLAVHLAEKVMRLPPNATIMLRRAQSGRTGTFESVMADICQRTGHTVRWCVPEGGGGQVYRRDYEMVEQADYVEAYFRPDAIMTGGTGHVVEAAMSRDVRVYAWSAGDHDGKGRILIERVGELEP